MTCRSKWLSVACTSIFVALLASPESRARAEGTTEACIQANADAQALRMQGKLAAARALLVECGATSCPPLVRDDCAHRFDELEGAQPTIVLDVKDARGADVAGVAVTIDGQAVPDALRGRAVPLDPGEHDFVFTAEGFSAANRHFILKEGEKGRRERVVLERGGGVLYRDMSADEPPPHVDIALPIATPPAATDAKDGPNVKRTLGFVAGGMGLAGIAIGTAFGFSTFSAVSAQKNDCGAGPLCDNRDRALSDHSTAVRNGAIATASFIAGGALVVTAAALLLTSSSDRSKPSTALALTPHAGPGEAGLSVHAEF